MPTTSHRSAQIAAMRRELAKLEAEERAERQAQKGRPVVLCTEHRGVFFGYAVDTSSDPIRVTECRMCVYWSKDVKGVMGLASGGPTDGCRVTKPVSEVELRGVTCVMECSESAVAAWERDVWTS